MSLAFGSDTHMGCLDEATIVLPRSDYEELLESDRLRRQAMELWKRGGAYGISGGSKMFAALEGRA